MIVLVYAKSKEKTLVSINFSISVSLSSDPILNSSSPIFMSLISHLYVSCENSQELEGKRFGFISYGSGSKSKVFEGTIQNNWKSKTKHLSLFDSLSNRTFIDFETYEKLHNGAINSPISNHHNIVLERIDQRENKTGFRHYFKNWTKSEIELLKVDLLL